MMQTAGRTETSQVPNGDTLSLDVLSKTVDQLKLELKKSQAEKQHAVEKLDSLLFLIKQSWNGDSSATVHLSRIVGLQLERETNGLTEKAGADQQSKRAVDNWLQLSVGLLDQEHKQDMLRMHQNQMSHIEQRYRYMEHVLHEHHRQMAQFAGHIDVDSSLGYHDNWDHLPQSSRAKRRHSLSMRRIKSATATNTRKASCPTEVDISKLCFKDLLIQPAPAVPRVTLTPKNNISYLKRPVSAFIPKKQPVKNMGRPKTAALTGLNRRKKKQNANSAKSAKETRHSISLPTYSPETEQIEPYKLTDLWVIKDQVEEKANNVSCPQKTLAKNRVTFAPKTVQLHETDEMKRPQSAKNNNFKKSTLQLQMRLGIPEESRVY